MRLTARQRWLLYLLAAVATGLAMLAGDGRPVDDVVLPVVRGAQAPGGAAPGAPAAGSEAALPAPDAGGATTLLLRPRTIEAPLSDPFATSLPAMPMAEAAAAAARAAATPAPAAAPALPFAYLGRWREQGRNWVFVARDGQTHRIGGPGPLDADYAVQAIDEQRIELVYLPLGMVQTLRLDQPAAAAGEGTSAALAATASGSPGAPATPAATGGADSPPLVEEN